MSKERTFRDVLSEFCQTHGLDLEISLIISGAGQEDDSDKLVDELVRSSMNLSGPRLIEWIDHLSGQDRIQLPAIELTLENGDPICICVARPDGELAFADIHLWISGTEHDHDARPDMSQEELDHVSEDLGTTGFKAENLDT